MLLLYLLQWADIFFYILFIPDVISTAQMMTELETVQLVDQAAFFFQMLNPEHWDQTMTWVNTTKTGSLKGIKLPGQQAAGAPAQTIRCHRVLRCPLRKHCQSNWRCLKVMTSVATNPRLQKTGGCCTQALPITVQLGPPSQEASSHWSPRQGISGEPSTYRSLSLFLCPCVCRLLSALTARHAGATPRTKQLL